MCQYACTYLRIDMELVVNGESKRTYVNASVDGHKLAKEMHNPPLIITLGFLRRKHVKRWVLPRPPAARKAIRTRLEHAPSEHVGRAQDAFGTTCDWKDPGKKKTENNKNLGRLPETSLPQKYTISFGSRLPPFNVAFKKYSIYFGSPFNVALRCW